VSERDDWDQATATPVEGVRILGAEEAQAALEGSQGSRRAPDNEQGALDLEAEQRAEAAEIGRPEEPSGEVPPLPHWTEPATGVVPAILADDEHDELDDDLEAWATVSGSQPRFRAEGSDWAEADFSEELTGEESNLGALSEDGPVDEEAEFAEALAARRRRPAKAAATPAKPKPPAPPREKPPAPRRPPREPDLAPPGPSAARDLPTAIATAGAVVVVALICFRLGTKATAVLAAVIVGVAAIEFSNALRTKGLRLATPLVLLASATMPLAAKHYGIGSYPVYFALVAVFSMLWFLLQVTPGRPLMGVAMSILVFSYIAGLGSFSGLLLGFHNGVGLVLGVVICVVAYDVFGFFIGSQFGRTAIAPNISPNKSVQGTVAGMFGSIVLGWVVVGAIGPWTHNSGLALGCLCAVGAFLGDLCESMIKRDLALKDFGTLLPGHGGVMDRFDSLLFCLPIAYYLALHLKIG
jgi:phosphatidate cytidylyltransferase